MYTLCEVDVKTVDKCRNCETSVSGESDRLRNHKIKRGAVTKNTPHKRSLDTNDIDENPTGVTCVSVTRVVITRTKINFSTSQCSIHGANLLKPGTNTNTDKVEKSSLTG